jgi:hypothetical protein
MQIRRPIVGHSSPDGLNGPARGLSSVDAGNRWPVTAIPRTVALAALAGLGAAALAALVVILRGGEFDATDWRLVGTLAAALFCGSAALAAFRLGPPLWLVALLPLAAFVFLAVAIWSDRVWESRPEPVAKGVVSAAAVTLAVLMVVSLRLQTPITGRPAELLYLGESALISVTMLVALALLWSWDASFFDGGGEGENVTNAAQRTLLALFSLSVVGYLATPLLARLLPPEPVGSRR